MAVARAAPTTTFAALPLDVINVIDNFVQSISLSATCKLYWNCVGGKWTANLQNGVTLKKLRKCPHKHKLAALRVLSEEFTEEEPDEEEEEDETDDLLSEDGEKADKEDCNKKQQTFELPNTAWDALDESSPSLQFLRLGAPPPEDPWNKLLVFPVLQTFIWDSGMHSLFNIPNLIQALPITLEILHLSGPYGLNLDFVLSCPLPNLHTLCVGSDWYPGTLEEFFACSSISFTECLEVFELDVWGSSHLQDLDWGVAANWMGSFPCLKTLAVRFWQAADLALPAICSMLKANKLPKLTDFEVRVQSDDMDVVLTEMMNLPTSCPTLTRIGVGKHGAPSKLIKQYSLYGFAHHGEWGFDSSLTVFTRTGPLLTPGAGKKKKKPAKKSKGRGAGSPTLPALPKKRVGAVTGC
eukprot:TRINITY_DN86372_c0_g1_i1.p1 TRINITY_DN86372_c0_g1~~TRINITY_DN86372_c0_g1_i1.p1  ORF type:complete len:410 (-),score=44.57 TRINITY_DN86372_c0_g1_i1:26-1255(-)